MGIKNLNFVVDQQTYLWMLMEKGERNADSWGDLMKDVFGSMNARRMKSAGKGGKMGVSEDSGGFS